MRLGFQALYLEVIPEALAAPIVVVVALWAQLLVVADMSTTATDMVFEREHQSGCAVGVDAC